MLRPVRTPLRVRGNAGLCSLEYLRELVAVAVIMAVLLILAGSTGQPSSQAAALAKAISKAPIYGVGFERKSGQVWVNQLFTGLTEYSPETGEMVSQWSGQRRSLTDVARGGREVITTVLSESVGTVLILRDDSVKVRFELPKSNQALTDVDVSDDGNLVVGAHPDGELLLWAWNGETFDQTTCPFPERADHVRISPDGRRLALGFGMRRAAIVEIATQQLVWNSPVHSHRLTQVVWSPDGTLIATGGEDGMVRLWDSTNYSLVRELQADSFAPSSVAFSADGRHLAAGGFEKLVRVWSVPDGSLLTTLTGHTGPVRSAAFDSQGKYLATGDLSGQIRIWSADDFRLIREL